MTYDIFISYRRGSAWAYAKMMHDRLVQDGYSVSFDTETLANGDFDAELLTRIAACKDFIILLTPGCFDRTVAGVKKEDDWVRIELSEALAQGKNIVPIAVGGFQYPPSLPDDIAKVRSKNWVEWQNRLIDAFYQDLEANFLVAERCGRNFFEGEGGTYVKVRDEPPRYARIEDFNQRTLKAMSGEGVGTENYLRTAYRDFMTLVLSERRAFSVVEYAPGAGYLGCTGCLMRNLLTENARLILAESPEAAVRFLKSVRDDVSGHLLFVLRCRNMSEYRAVLSIWNGHPELSMMIGVGQDSADVLKAVRRDDCFHYRFDFLSEFETQEYLEALSSEYRCALPQRLLETLHLPAMRAVRTPTLLRTVVSNLGLLDDLDNVAFNPVRIIEIIDAYLLNLNPDLSVAIDRMVSVSYERGSRECGVADVREDLANVERLVELGVIKRRGSRFSLSCSAYFACHLSCHALDRGCDYLSVDLSRFPESVPYYIYQYYRKYSDLTLDAFELDEGQVAVLLQLFSDDDDVLRRLLLSRRYDRPAMALLGHLVATGGRDLARQMIGIYESAGIASCEELDYLSRKIRLAYESEGVFLPTEETHGDILHQLGYIHYCRDEYALALDCFSRAYAAARDRGTADPRLAFEYIEVLLDSGRYGAVEQVVRDLDEGLDGSDEEQLAEYYFVKAICAKNAGDVVSAQACIEKCIASASRTADLSRLSVCYGELGNLCLGRGEYDAALAHYERNLYISRMLMSFNGMCIASKMMGRVHLLKRNYLEAYRCFSYSSMFGKKAGNVWRVAKLDVLLWTVLEDGDNFDDAVRSYCAKVDSDVFRCELLTLYSQYKYSIGRQGDAVLYARDAAACAKRVEYRLGENELSVWLDFLEGRPVPPQSPFADELLRTAAYLDDLREREVHVTTPLPFYKYREMETPRLMMKLVNRSDAQDMFDYCSDPENTRYVFWDCHRNVNDTYCYIDGLLDMKTIGESMTWALFHKDEHVVIGTVDLVYNEKFQGVELGYIVNRRFWRKGYAYEACRAVLDFARDELGLEQVYAAAFAVNDASNGLLGKCGFRFVRELPGYHAKLQVSDRRGRLYVLDLRRPAESRNPGSESVQAASQASETCVSSQFGSNDAPPHGACPKDEEDEAERTFLSRAKRFKRNDGVIDDTEYQQLVLFARRLGINAVRMETLIERVECEFEDERDLGAARLSPAALQSPHLDPSPSPEPAVVRYQVVIGSQVTKADIEEAVGLDALSYAECFRGNLHDCLEWARANPDIYVMLRDRRTGHVIAYINVMPVTDECYDVLRSGKFIDVSITPDMILSYDMPVPYSIYFSSVVIHPDYRNSGVFKHLFNAIVQRFLDLGQNEIFIRRMLADAVSAEGEKFCKLFGMKKVDNSQHGSTLYEVSMIPPKFRVTSKMTKQLHDYYQAKYDEDPYLFDE